MLIEERSCGSFWPTNACRTPINGWHSESDNIFESLPRLLEMCLVACEFEADLRQSAAAEDRGTIIKELTDLESALRAARGFLDDTVHLA